MTTLAWLALAGFVLTALADHWAVATRTKAIEYVAKPATMLWLGLLILAADHSRPEIVGWWIAAVVLSLAGDVFLMLPVDRFVFGLAAFLLAHVAYIVGFAQEGVGDGWWIAALVLVPVAGALLATMMRGPGMKAPLRVPVIAYVSTIVVMVTCAWASGEIVVALGATAFMASDALIGWRRFVRETSWMPLAIIVLYHLGQLGLAYYVIA